MSADRQTRRPRILVIAYDFPPHAAIGTMRTLRVVRELDARGWDVTVLTGHQSSYLPATPVDPALLSRVPPNVRIIRARSIHPWNGLQALVSAALGHGTAPVRAGDGSSPSPSAAANRRSSRRGVKWALAGFSDVVDAALSIPDRESGWLVSAIRRGLGREIRGAKPDVIYSSAPPWTGQLVAAALKATLRRPWLADFRDPWARAPWRHDRYRFALQAASSLERLVIRRADRIVFVAAANKDEFAQHYGRDTAAKFDVIPNGCDPAEFEALGAAQIADDGPFTLLHAGSLYGGRTPTPLLKAVALAISRGDLVRGQFRVQFLGVNALKSVDLSTTCRDLGLEQVVEFLPRVTRERSLRTMMAANGLLLLQPGHTVSVPGKLYEYFAAARPIFAIAEEGETSDLVRQSGLGVSVSPDDDAVIADALTAFVKSRGQRVTAPPRVLYDGTMRAGQVVDILDGMLGTAPMRFETRNKRHAGLHAEGSTRGEFRQ